MNDETALLSVSVVRTITTYRKVGAFLYCVKVIENAVAGG